MSVAGEKGIERIRGLYAVIDTTYVTPRDIKVKTMEIIAGGARVLQLRAKGLTGGEFLRAAMTLRGLTAKNDVLFIVNDRVDVAMMAGADGVHLGREDIPVENARKLLGPSAIIGSSTHNMEEALTAERSQADYIAFGPILPTKTKKDAEPEKGIEALKRIVAGVKKPVVAIGGITVGDVTGVMRTGASAVVMISGILTAGDIRKTVSSVMALTEDLSLPG